MRPNKDLVGIVLLLGLFIGAAIFMAGRSTSTSREVGDDGPKDPSVYNDRASGSQAFYELVRKAGYRPQVLRKSYMDLSQTQAAVLIAVEPQVEQPESLTGDNNSASDNSAPSTILGSGDAIALKSWLNSGRTAVILTSKMPSSRTAGSTDTSNDSFGDAIHVIVDSTSTEGEQSEFGALEPTPLADGVTSVHCFCDPPVRIETTSPHVLGLFGDAAGPVVALVPVGRGRIIVVADGEFASNRPIAIAPNPSQMGGSLGSSDNAAFLGNILSRYAKPGDEVLFDEFHHGEEEVDSGVSLWPALGRPLQLAFIQLLLAALVVVGVVAVRFGSPVPLNRSSGRTTAEYVTSLAALYWKAGASSTALEMIYKQFLRELTSRLGLSADVNLEQLADMASRRGGINQMELRRVLAACERIIDTGKVSEPELLDLVRRIDRIRKEIGIV